MKTEAQHLLNQGATARELAADLGISRGAAEYIAQTYRAPRNTVKRSFLNSLPEHLQRQTLAWNPTIIEDVTP